MSMESQYGMILTWENQKIRRKTCTSANFSSTHPTRSDRGANPGLRNQRSATDRLSHGTTLVRYWPSFTLMQLYSWVFAARVQCDTSAFGYRPRPESRVRLLLDSSPHFRSTNHCHHIQSLLYIRLPKTTNKYRLGWTTYSNPEDGN
jgi:hypothetical protein